MTKILKPNWDINKKITVFRFDSKYQNLANAVEIIDQVADIVQRKTNPYTSFVVDAKGIPVTKNPQKLEAFYAKYGNPEQTVMQELKDKGADNG